MDVFISVEGEDCGSIEVWEGIEEKEFMRKVRELTGMKDLEMKEDLNLDCLIQDEVIDFSLPSRIMNKRYLEEMGKCNIKSFVENEDVDLLGAFLDVFDINEISEDGYTALMYSCSIGNIEMVELLIERGADIEIPTSKISSLNIASRNNYIKVVKLLLDRGADIENKDNRGMTPLNSASNKGHKEVVKLLLDRGADIENENYLYMTPLNSASEEGNEEVVKLLLDREANIESRDTNGMTSLNNATMKEHIFAVKTLINNGANIKSRNAFGYTPLYMANRKGYLDIVKLMNDSLKKR